MLTTKSEGGVGTYGQFALGTAAILGNTGWIAYARGDYRVGDVVDGWGVSTGLRYEFSPEQRTSIKDGPSYVVYGYDWNGPYIGAFAGTMWGDTTGRFLEKPPLPQTPFTPDLAGYLAGVEAGYNVQFGRAVLGIEADYGATNAHGAVKCPNAFFYNCQTDADQLASVAARLGVTWGRALFYGKAGWAGGEISSSLKQNPSSTFGFLATPVETTKWLNGWTVGGGMEFAISDRWSAKAEYMHYDFGSDKFLVTSLPEVVDVHPRTDVVRVGVNLHLQPRAEAEPLK